MDKETILQNIERLKAASPREGWDAFAPLVEAVEEYFTPQEGLERLIGECAYQMVYNYEYRNTVFANQKCMLKFNENYPKGYEDVRDIFDGDGVWKELEEVQEDSFAAAFQYPPASVSDSDTGETITNPYIDEWVVRVNTSRANIIPSLEQINAFCEADATNYGLAVYFEEHGETISAPTHKEIAEHVFVARGYADIIRTYGFTMHIPSYIEN